eukprot:ANDGO_04457.mRNA.1 N-terminal acetyltransferase A complex subunit nat1
MVDALPSKDASNFRAMVRLYESKEYKRSIKTADAILKSHPNHGETLSMKGLVLSQMGDAKRSEAFDYAKKGLMFGIKSHVCWHVYGLLYRQDRKYVEAIKSYKNALRIDPENTQIWRDLSLLQVQLRDVHGYVESRRKILEAKPTGRISWLSLVIAHQLCKDFDMALKVLEAYEGTVVKDSAEAHNNFEQSEINLYKVQLQLESGNVDAAYDTLVSKETAIVDKVSYMELKALLAEKKGLFDVAKAEYEKLVKRIPGNVSYISSLLRCTLASENVFDDVDTSIYVSKVEEIAASFPRTASFCTMLVLQRLRGSELEERLSKFVYENVSKGVPSLWSSLKSLYKIDASNAAVMQRVFEKFSSNSETNSEARLWSRVALARHHDFLGDHALSLRLIEECMSESADIPDFFIVKARILKHEHRLHAAFEVAESGRKLDVSDRFMNAFAVKYAIRAGRVSKAEELMALFAAQDGGKPNTFDMQSSWYEVEVGDAFAKLGLNIPKAIAQYSAVEKHFQDFREDEYDFHTYCLRKMTLRAYMKLLDWESSVFQHVYYRRSVVPLVHCLIKLVDFPYIIDSFNQPEEEISGELDEKEKKKLQRKRNKEKARQEEQNQSQKEKEKDDAPKHDFSGAEVVAAKDHLSLAAQYARNLSTHCIDFPEALEAVFEVAFRRRKWCQVVRVLGRLARLRGPNDHFTFVACSRFLQAWQQGAEKVDKRVVEVLDQEKQVLEQYVFSFKGSALAGLEAQAWTNEGVKSTFFESAVASISASSSRDDACAVCACIGRVLGPREEKRARKVFAPRFGDDVFFRVDIQ